VTAGSEQPRGAGGHRGADAALLAAACWTQLHTWLGEAAYTLGAINHEGWKGRSFQRPIRNAIEGAIVVAWTIGVPTDSSGVNGRLVAVIGAAAEVQYLIIAPVVAAGR